MSKKVFLASVPLGIVTGFLIALAGRYLPYSQTRDTITDALKLPGWLIARLVYPAGIHTSGGSGFGYVLLVGVSNWMVYALVWLLCLMLVGRIRDRRQRKAHQL